MSANTLQSLVYYLHVDVFSIVVMLLQRLILGYIICESSETHQISIYTNQFISTNIITGRVHSFLRHKKTSQTTTKSFAIFDQIRHLFSEGIYMDVLILVK